MDPDRDDEDALPLPVPAAPWRLSRDEVDAGRRGVALARQAMADAMARSRDHLEDATT